MNIVIPCIDNGEQLKYCLRSLENSTGISRVLVVGAIPKWYKGEFIKHEAEGINTKDQANKLLLAMKYLNDEPFVYVHDDHVFHTSLDFDNLPQYCQSVSFSEKVAKYTGNRGYLRHLTSTLGYLQAGKLQDMCFEGHTTTRVDNIPLMKMCLAAVLNHPTQLQFQSLYGSAVGEGVPIPNCKPRFDMNLAELLEFMKYRPYLSVNEKSLAYGVGEYLRETFKNKSKYEL